MILLRFVFALIGLAFVFNGGATYLDQYKFREYGLEAEASLDPAARVPFSGRIFYTEVHSQSRVVGQRIKLRFLTQERELVKAEVEVSKQSLDDLGRGLTVKVLYLKDNPSSVIEAVRYSPVPVIACGLFAIALALLLPGGFKAPEENQSVSG